jgi:hypothetical protein
MGQRVYGGQMAIGMFFDRKLEDLPSTSKNI